MSKSASEYLSSGPRFAESDVIDRIESFRRRRPGCSTSMSRWRTAPAERPRPHWSTRFSSKHSGIRCWNRSAMALL
ncbi:hydrogenase maturation factor, HypE domain protein [Mycobacterium xenopi 4042]|uniref:Hydrogenase maturation factor, HypE domain protein n=1 Tax=Mycobacterium xenopi 4042 TaxID=1299334 RepID=X7Z5H9_MYCXE|nr:hydrogenase maturation factor, HypE domain protein [Mycobacterium xenopi 4042]